MAEHFKLEITNRSTKITTWTGVSDDFANEYKERLGVDDSLPDDYIPAPMSDALKTVLNPPPPENADKDKPNENQIVSKSSAKKNDGKYAKYNYAKRVKKRRSTFRTLAYINFRTPNVQFVIKIFCGSSWCRITTQFKKDHIFSFKDILYSIFTLLSKFISKEESFTLLNKFSKSCFICFFIALPFRILIIMLI